MDCSITCTEDIANQQTVGILTRFRKWLQTLKIESAEQLSKIK